VGDLMKTRVGGKEWDLPVESLTWRAAAARELGDAQVMVPWEHDACSSTYLDEEHAFPVEIDAGDAGAWYGVAESVTTDARGVRLACRENGQVAQGRYAGDASFDGATGSMTAGAIVRAALQAALGGLGAGVVIPDVIVEGPPAIESYDIDGKTLLQVLADMQQATGCEWRIRHTGNGDYFDWLPPLAPLHDPLLVDGGAVMDVTREVRAAERIWEVIGKDSAGRLIRRRANEVIGPAGVAPQRVIDLGTSAETAQGAVAVAAELAAARHAGVTFSARLVDAAAIAVVREGMTVRLHAPHAALAAGMTAPTCRVLGRTLRGDGRAVDLTLQYLRAPATGALEQATITPPAVTGREDDLLRVVGIGYQGIRAALGMR
jgi:hypothetical protein